MAPGLESDRNNEEWMKTLPEELWDIPLTNLAIPGGKTHSSIRYIAQLDTCAHISACEYLQTTKYRTISCFGFVYSTTLYLSNMADALTHRNRCYVTSARSHIGKVLLQHSINTKSMERPS